MSFTRLNRSYDSYAEDYEVDVEIEFYNVPDTRIIDMLEEAYFESE